MKKLILAGREQQLEMFIYLNKSMSEKIKVTFDLDQTVYAEFVQMTENSSYMESLDCKFILGKPERLIENHMLRCVHQYRHFLADSSIDEMKKLINPEKFV